MIMLNKQLRPGDVVRKNNGKKEYFVVESTNDGQWVRFDVRSPWIHNSSLTIIKTAEQLFKEIEEYTKQNVNTNVDTGATNSN